MQFSEWKWKRNERFKLKKGSRLLPCLAEFCTKVYMRSGTEIHKARFVNQIFLGKIFNLNLYEFRVSSKLRVNVLRIIIYVHFTFIYVYYVYSYFLFTSLPQFKLLGDWKALPLVASSHNLKIISVSHRCISTYMLGTKTRKSPSL